MIADPAPAGQLAPRLSPALPVGCVSPRPHLAGPMRHAPHCGPHTMQTGFPPAAPLLVLAGYAAVFGFLARRLFRGE